MIFKNKKKQLQENFGQRPHTMYFDGDMARIQAHYNFRCEQKLDEFLIDDITWHDLSMDDLFKQINTRLTTSGEQYLYYLLRSPTLDQSEYEKRYALIKFMEDHPDLRLKLQVIFSKLGRKRDVKLHENFVSVHRKYWKLMLYLFLSMTLLLLPIVGFLIWRENPILPLLFIAQLIFNILFHMYITRGIEYELQTVNYILGMVASAKKIKKLDLTQVGSHFKKFNASVNRLKSLNGIAFSIEDGKGEQVKDELTMVFTYILNKLFFVDLIAFELVKNKLGKYHQEIFYIHETIGSLDASIAIASYRAGLNSYSLPTINFSNHEERCLKITDVVHPLVKEPISNSIDTRMPILLTGSNASGKSTFLRSVTMNMIMAQSICTVLAKNYEASAFYIYSSMAIADNLLAGDSYFIAEIKSMKRIVDAISIKRPTFCVIDEILRGTNTIERISASSELLKLIADKNALCFAATHDIELCELLKQDYRMLHFTESITASGEVAFDYLLREGPARTRNAIKLLEALGFDNTLVNAANERASRYIEQGRWV